ncbi:hypothetical protein BKI52_01655 [marine bacterium AO1-C]|nr:hypothetical protein BKI52_01655 [marine bacterium AO1-C]
MKEYGRNIQKIADYIAGLEDREKRTKYAYTLVELMRQINPNMRDSQDTQNKLWDDLYIMSGFEIDVESPFPMPAKDKLGKRPKMLGYNTHRLHFKHYGRNIELLVEKALEEEAIEDQLGAVVYVAKLMKGFYASWNKDNIDDETVLGHIEKIAGKPLKPDLRERIVQDKLLDTQKERGKNHHNNNRNKGGRKNDNRKRRN